MLEEVNRLTSLIDSLLTIARADSGHLQLHRGAVPLMALAREAAGLFEVLMEEKSLHLAMEGDEHVEVEADVLFLRQALVNVIHNAVKYSPAGETVSVRVQNVDPDQVTVEVRDRGPGIPPEHRARIFDRFYRVDAARQRESGGGAGLGPGDRKGGRWRANGGSIYLDGATGRGCTFRINLPRLRRVSFRGVGSISLRARNLTDCALVFCPLIEANGQTREAARKGRTIQATKRGRATRPCPRPPRRFVVWDGAMPA